MRPIVMNERKSTYTPNIEELQQGSQQAWGTLVDETRPDLIRTAKKIVVDLGTAEDAAQEAYLRLHRRLPELVIDPREHNIPGYLVITARNIALDKVKRSKPESLVGDDHQLATSKMPDSKVNVANEAIERAEGAENLHSMLDAWEITNPDHREILLLRASGLTDQEIADYISSPVATVRTRLHRARNIARETTDPRK